MLSYLWGSQLDSCRFRLPLHAPYLFDLIASESLLVSMCWVSAGLPSYARHHTGMTTVIITPKNSDVVATMSSSAILLSLHITMLAWVAEQQYYFLELDCFCSCRSVLWTVFSKYGLKSCWVDSFRFLPVLPSDEFQFAFGLVRFIRVITTWSYITYRQLSVAFSFLNMFSSADQRWFWDSSAPFLQNPLEYWFDACRNMPAIVIFINFFQSILELQYPIRGRWSLRYEARLQAHLLGFNEHFSSE